MNDSGIPTTPILIYNAEFPSFHLNVCGSFDNEELIAWTDGGSAVNQVWTLVKKGTGYHLLSTVLKDQNGAWLQGPKTVYAVANNPGRGSPQDGTTVRVSSTAGTNPTTFDISYVKSSSAFQISVRRGPWQTFLLLTLENGSMGAKLKLNESSDQLRQLWKFKPAEPGLRLGPGQ